jgi:broad specificity phosphatase PhoE
VSHQLPIWTLRRYVEGRPMWHRPDRRQCGLASLTSLTWDGDRLLTVTYSEPAGRRGPPPGRRGVGRSSLPACRPRHTGGRCAPASPDGYWTP